MKLLSLGKKVSAALLLTVCSAAAAGSFPDKPLTILVGFPPGQATDILARMVADTMSKSMGQPVIVENKPGQSGGIAVATLKRARPDGYTMMLSAAAAIVINPHVYKDLPYDSLSDLTPIGLAGDLPLVLAANPATPYDTITDFVKYAKAHPGEVNFSSSGTGTVNHLSMTALGQQAGIDIVHVPYQGSVKAMTDLAAGNVSVGLETVAGSKPLVDGGKLKIIGISSKELTQYYPDAPLFADQGFGDLKANAWIGMFYPKGTPSELAIRINKELQKAISDPGILDRMKGIGIVPMTSESPGEFADMVRSDYEEWGTIASDAGIEQL